MMKGVRFIHLHPACQHMVTTASHVLTLDILRVIDNEVAVPHHREIHRQLTDFHSLVQILEAEDSEKERWEKRKEQRQKERRISMGGLGIEIPTSPCRCSTMSFQSYPQVSSSHHQSWQSEKPRGIGQLSRSLSFPSGLWICCPLLPHMPLIPAWLSFCKCGCVWARERVRLRGESKCVCVCFLWEYTTEVRLCLTPGLSHTAVFSSVITEAASTVSPLTK